MAFALVAGAICAGCAVDQKAEIAKYRAILDGLGSPPVAYSPGGPLDLLTAMRLANLHNEELAIEGENYVQALIDKQRAAAAFQPTISLIPSYSLADESTDRGNARTGGDTDDGDPSDNDPSRPGRGSANATGDGRLDVPLNARMNVFNGLRDLSNYRRFGDVIHLRAALLRDLQQTILLEVAQVYYEIIRSEELVNVLENTVRLQEERVRNIRARERAGFAPALDVAQTEAQAAETRVTLIAARDDVWTGRTTLAFLTNAAVADCPLIDDYNVPAELPDAQVWVEEAEESRQDLAAARAGVAAAVEAARAATEQYYPSVSLNFNYFLSRESSPADSDWNSLISASLPIFTGGIIHANVRAAFSRLRQAKLDESLTYRQVEHDVLLARQALATSDLRYAQLGAQNRAAQQAFRTAQVQYNAGSATNLDLLTAQDLLLSSQLDLTSERFVRKVLYLNLLRSSGMLDLRDARTLVSQ